MNVRPLRDRILLERIEEGEQRVGGIIIPDTAKEKPQQAKVVAVGNGRVNDKGEVFPLDVKAGDTVLFGKYSGTEIKIDGQGLSDRPRGRGPRHRRRRARAGAGVARRRGVCRADSAKG